MVGRFSQRSRISAERLASRRASSALALASVCFASSSVVAAVRSVCFFSTGSRQAMVSRSRYSGTSTSASDTFSSPTSRALWYTYIAAGLDWSSASCSFALHAVERSEIGAKRRRAVRQGVEGLLGGRGRLLGLVELPLSGSHLLLVSGHGVAQLVDFRIDLADDLVELLLVLADGAVHHRALLLCVLSEGIPVIDQCVVGLLVGVARGVDGVPGRLDCLHVLGLGGKLLVGRLVLGLVILELSLEPFEELLGRLVPWRALAAGWVAAFAAAGWVAAFAAAGWVAAFAGAGGRAALAGVVRAAGRGAPGW